MLSQKKHGRARRRNKSSCNLELLMRRTKGALILDMDVDVTYPYADVRRRDPKHPDFVGCDPYLFKRFTQALNFDKRIIWSCDRSFDELSKEALNDFKDSQLKFLLPEPVSQRGNRVIQLARDLCTHILGPFSYETWFDSCSFGKRAAVGLPRSVSYLDTRFERLSGTEMQLTAFNECLARDVHLFRAVRKRSTRRTLVNEIKATTVPKSFKAARVIAPDTVLGGFLSRGLGDYIRGRLEKETHINLSKQQDRHRRWAKEASRKGHLATIDMSKASDSFTWRHIEVLVPEDWHHALDCVRTRRCNVGDGTIDLQSYMLMGSGHTFPLQSLLFFCLAEATRQLCNCTGKVSVYGDDIIIPTRMSTRLIKIFEELGFVINSEKSFFDKPDKLRPSQKFFRESCGGDFKGGVDVRPLMPECDLQARGMVPRNEYAAWCHKLINGLLDHWDVCEIPLTVSYLLGELGSTSKRRVCFVPTWEVDHAGIRHYIPPTYLSGLDVSYISYRHSHPTYWRLVYTQSKRARSLDERPYLWLAYFLQPNAACVPVSFPWLIDKLRKELGTPLYSEPPELGGENRKDLEGVFRWKKAGPNRLRK